MWPKPSKRFDPNGLEKVRGEEPEEAEEPAATALYKSQRIASGR